MPNGLSDEDFFGSGSAAPQVAIPAGTPNPTSLNGLSDEDFFNPKSTASTAPKSDSSPIADTARDYLSRVGRIAGDAVNDIGAQESKPLDTSNPIAAIGDVAGRTVRGALDAANAPSSIVQGGLESGYRSAVDALAPNAPQSLREQQARDFGEVGVGPATMAIGAAGNVAHTVKEGLSGLADKYVEGEYEPPPVAPPITKGDIAQSTKAQNEKFIDAISGNLNAMKGVKNEETGQTEGGFGEIYDKAGATASGVTTNAPNIQKTVNNILGNLKKDPTHYTAQGTSQAYDDFEAISKSFDEDGNISLGDISLLKKRVNDLYSPNASQARLNIYNAANKQVNNLVNQARDENPEWASLMDHANGLFLNYKKTRDSFNNAWSIEDQKEWEDAAKAKLTDPNAAPAPSSVREKVQNISSPQNIQQYEDTMRMMPRDLQDEYTKSVIENNPSDSRIIRGIRAAYRATLGQYHGAANDAYNAATMGAAKRIDPATATQYPHIEDATNAHLTAARDIHQGWLDDQAEAAAQRNKPMLALPAPSINLPANQSGLYKALPAPGGGAPINTANGGYPLINDRSGNFGSPARGNVRPMTQDELGEYFSNKQSTAGPELGMTTDVRAANQQRAATQVADRLTAERANYEKNPRDLSDLVNALQANKGSINADWNKLDAAALQQKIGQIEKAWIGHEGDLRDAILSGRARAQQMASVRGEPYSDTAMSDALLRAIGAKARGGSAYASGGAVNTQPTPAQKAVGNYKKGKVKWHGLDISIENPKGSERSGVSPDGKKWSSTLGADYGYIRRHIGADGDHLDCYIGQHPASKRVYVMDQLVPETGKFDEHKCFLDFPSREEALKAYHASFDRGGKSSKRVGHVSRLTIQEFRDWLKSGNTQTPIGKAA